VHPGNWSEAPVANEAVAESVDAPTSVEAVETPVASATRAPEPSSPVIAQPASVDATVDEAAADQTAVEAAVDQPDADHVAAANAPRAPGLFDAMPPEDPAQAAADAARDARNADARNA